MLNFAKRINRLTYFVGVLLSLVVFAVGALGIAAYGSSGSPTADQIGTIALWLWLVLVALYNLCLIKQRCNDVSNDHAVLFTVLFAACGVSFILFFIPGEKKANQYGHIPKKGVNLTLLRSAFSPGSV